MVSDLHCFQASPVAKRLRPESWRYENEVLMKVYDKVWDLNQQEKKFWIGFESQIKKIILDWDINPNQEMTCMI